MDPMLEQEWLSIPPRNFGSHVTVSPSASNTGKRSEMSDFLASVEVCNVILHIHVVVSWQLSKQGIRWPVSKTSLAGSGVDPSRLRFFKLSPDK